MSDAIPSQSLSEDIAFVRALALEGQKTPLRGDISLAAGLIWGSASLATWSVLAHVWQPPAPGAAIGWSWGGAALIFAVAGVPLGMYRSSPNTNKIAAAAWGGVGLACWTISAATTLAVWRTRQELIITIIPAVIMALYGGGWLVGAAAYRQPWQRWLGLACLFMSLVLGATAGRAEEYLLFALALYGLMGVTGLIAVLRNHAKG